MPLQVASTDEDITISIHVPEYKYGKLLGKREKEREFLCLNLPAFISGFVLIQALVVPTSSG